MVTMRTDALSSHSWLPAGWSNGIEVVLRRHARHAREDIAEVSQRVDATALAGDHDRVDDRRALAGIGMAHEEPVLLPDGRGADGILDEVIVELGDAVFEVRRQRRPVAQQVIAGLAHGGLGPRPRPQASRHLLQPVQWPGVIFAPVLLPLGRGQLVFVPDGLGLLEPADDRRTLTVCREGRAVGRRCASACT